jgi:hypothetical protein
VTQGRTRLPLAIDDWDRVWADQLIRAIDQNIEALESNIQNSVAITGYYGSFYSTVNQTAAAANTAYAMTFNNTDSSNQIAVVSNSRITFKNRGIYNLQFSAQIRQTSGSPHTIWIWLRKNGVNVPNTTGQTVIQGSKGELVPAWNYIVSVLGGDYVELVWAVEDTSTRLAYDAATAFAPATPSVIATAVSV